MSLLLALAHNVAPVDYTLACDAGAYSIAGQNASLSVARTLVCEAGSYTITGKAATLTVVSTQQETYSGGYYPLTRRKTKKEVYAERLKMGIVKEDIQKKAVEVVAKVAEKVNYAPAYHYDPDKLVKQLMSELRVKVPSPDYTRAIELALKIAEQDEEDALLLLAY